MFVLFASTSWAGVSPIFRLTMQEELAWNAPVAPACRLMQRLSPRFVEMTTKECVALTFLTVHGTRMTITATVATPTYRAAAAHPKRATRRTTKRTGTNVREIGRTSADRPSTTPNAAHRFQPIRRADDGSETTSRTAPMTKKLNRVSVSMTAV